MQSIDLSAHCRFELFECHAGASHRVNHQQIAAFAQVIRKGRHFLSDFLLTHQRPVEPTAAPTAEDRAADTRRVILR